MTTPGGCTSGVLYPANMVASRRGSRRSAASTSARAHAVAEDNDLCYRWLRDGRPLRYEPDLVVWHHDWRTPEQLVRTHVAYARAQGGFYAKHLQGRRPPRVLPSAAAGTCRHGLAQHWPAAPSGGGPDGRTLTGRWWSWLLVGAWSAAGARRPVAAARRGRRAGNRGHDRAAPRSGSPSATPAAWAAARASVLGPPRVGCSRQSTGGAVEDEHGDGATGP